MELKLLNTDSRAELQILRGEGLNAGKKATMLDLQTALRAYEEVKRMKPNAEEQEDDHPEEKELYLNKEECRLQTLSCNFLQRRTTCPQKKRCQLKQGAVCPTTACPPEEPAARQAEREIRMQLTSCKWRRSWLWNKRSWL
ncbi:hypothetical protein NDU88_002417 [Pleurodeles waltl]|uniref:Uncharacterized protein n=1 Tax=Pleurodeles waltl TaxID=8319 RepID=A0AAV7WPF1_PLEWA|nr:hypothetical protein NDU88_002417 [Pleurodeles waltl]